MDVEHGSYYRVNKYLLSIIGQWPYQTKFEKFSVISFTYVALISLIIPEILGLIEYWGDVDTVIECLPPIIVILASSTLLTSCIYKTKKIKRVVSRMNENWKNCSSTSEIAIQHVYAKRGEQFTITFAFAIFSTLFIYIALPILPEILDLIMPMNETRPKQTLYPTEYYVDVDTYFYWMLAHSYVSSFMSVAIVVAVDTLFIVFLQHACGQLSILGVQMKNLVKEDYDDSKIEIQNEIEQKIKLCAIKHKEIVQLVYETSDCFSTSFFLVLGLNMIIMSVTGVQTVMKLDDFHEAMRFGTFTLGQMFHLFYISVPCQQLIDHSVEISDNIYDGYWYRLSSGSRKKLLIIMRRCLKPCSFTAGKVYTYSIENFAAVLQTSMSYFTVLSSVR